MSSITRACLLLSCAFAASAQLTPEQKTADLTNIAGIYAKHYAPYEWKRDVIGFDLMNLQPWLDRAAKTADDLEFMDLLVEYVASLNDGHDVITFPSDFSADLGFDVDIYEGKVLIDNIYRSMLPARQYPFQVGDELVSIDGQPVDQLLKKFSKYGMTGNPRSTARLTTGWLTYRLQSWIPRAHEIGETATVVIRRDTGAMETYSIPWIKSGTPVLRVGPVPNPKGGRPAALFAPPTDDTLSPFMQYSMQYMRERAPARPAREVRGIGSITPVFALPSGFVRRNSSYFYSGTFTSDTLRIGYIRIPDFQPTSTSSALSQFAAEIRYFQQNTDGLIVDVMRNPGGYGSYAESLCQILIPEIFRTMGHEIRATSDWVAYMSSLLEETLYYGGEDWVICNMESNLNAVRQANSENRGRTGSISLNATGSLPLLPASTVYTKPLMVLTDEVSASAAEAFAATIQDNQRGKLFGYRTMGLGGSVRDFDAGVYTEGLVSVTRTLMTRKNPVSAEGYPTTAYIENVGVHPDIVEDYMTKDNLMKSGRPFVDVFTKAMVEHIKASKGN